MARTLVIKGADFSTNKLDTVIFEETVPCTGITISQSTASLTNVGTTLTLTATVAPANTTDAIIWVSSNENVVTVASGVITVVGVGTATVTATCGNYSASCEVSTTAFMQFTGVVSSYLYGVTSYSGGNGRPYLNYDASAYLKRACLVASSGTLHFYNETNGVMYYPYAMPKNTARVKITTPTGTNAFYITDIQWCSSTVCAEGMDGIAQLVEKIGTSDITTVNGVSTVSVPSYTGYPTMDAIAIGLRMTADVEFLESYLENATVEFLPAA